MTDREKAIVMAYTGFTMLAGDKLGIYYTYVQEKLGRSVMTHELAYQEVQDAIQEAAKEDFIAIAKEDNCWISVKDRLPEIGAKCLVYADGKMTVAKHIANNDWITGVWFPVPTYWMPLPEPPKEEKV